MQNVMAFDLYLSRIDLTSNCTGFIATKVRAHLSTNPLLLSVVLMVLCMYEHLWGPFAQCI